MNTIFLINEKQTKHSIQIWYLNDLYKKMVFKFSIYKQKDAIPKKLVNVFM